MTNLTELFAKVEKTNSPVLKFEFMPRHKTWIATHVAGFQSEVSLNTVNFWSAKHGTKVVMP